MQNSIGVKLSLPVPLSGEGETARDPKVHSVNSERENNIETHHWQTTQDPHSANPPFQKLISP